MDELELFDSWEQSGLNLKNRVSGTIKCTCPKCSHTRKNSRDECVSVNITDQVWNCKHCGWKGGVRKHIPKNQTGTQYALPKYEPQPLTEKLTTWFEAKRGIARATLDHFMIFPNRKWISKAGKEVDCIGFPYFDRGVMVNIKSRYDYVEVIDDKKVAKKTFGLEKDAKKVLHNVDAIRGQKRVILVEGEIDTMSVHQAGWLAVASVPNGAPPLKADAAGNPLPMEQQPQINLDYLDPKDFEAAEEIIIATDGDAVGRRLRDEIARRLGKERCKFVNWVDEQHKDFNFILQQYGEDGVMQAINEWVVPFPVEGIVGVDDTVASAWDYYQNGYPKGVAIRHQKFSELLTFRGGEITTITGTPGSGKSEWLDEILVDLAGLHGWGNAIFGAENGGPDLHLNRIIHRYIGKPVVEDVKKNIFPRMEPEEWQRGAAWAAPFFHWIDLRKVGRTVDDILSKAAELVRTKGIKALVIDPWNYLEGNKPSGMDGGEYVSQVYTKLLAFAEDFNCHVFVVAHPVKMPTNEDGTFKVPNMYSISGSAHFYNKTFNGITVYRRGALVEIYVQKVKFDFVGQQGMQEFVFNPYKRRYSEV